MHVNSLLWLCVDIVKIFTSVYQLFTDKDSCTIFTLGSYLSSYFLLCMSEADNIKPVSCMHLALSIYYMFVLFQLL